MPDILAVSVDELRPGRYQPRLQLRQEGLAELAESIREQGVLQPLIVRAVSAVGGDPTTYEIVAGERRWRAARLAGLTTVPVIVRELTDQEALAVALIENLQREDLNPIDQAQSMSRLVAEFGMTHEQIAKALGRSRASVSNFLRLLELADDVKTAMVDGKLDMGHARALLSLDSERQAKLARKIVRLGWSARKVEQTVKILLEDRASGSKLNSAIDIQTRWLERQLARELGETVTIRPGQKGGYVLQLGFADLANLDESLQRLHELVRQIRAAAGPRARESARDPKVRGGES
ncbi:MAG TPA: ParB/RepB/Spo0J family partition protein [Gammaproteobacteria bacterium]|nr:ParB/RepB/Spo0J family partition protein [Gammaproteobacteria bacterium]